MGTFPILSILFISVENKPLQAARFALAENQFSPKRSSKGKKDHFDWHLSHANYFWYIRLYYDEM